MSTENVEVFNRYYGNGVATQFSVGFPYLKREFVKVYLYKKDTDEEKVLNSDQFSFVNDATIQYPVLPTDEILEEGDILTIQRETTLGSEFEFDNQRRLFPVEVMNADDLAFQQIQELSREIKRAIRVNPTATESPEELLQTVYDKLDSATEVAEDAIIAANQAQVAADNATAAVESAEQTLVETQAYVDSAKIEINDTKETAIEEVDIKVTDAKADINSTVVTAQADITSVKDTAIDAVEAAVVDLGQTVTQAKADIDNTKTTAETSITNTVNQGKADIQGYIDDAEDEVRQIARDEAQSAIADAKQDVQAYTDTTIKPSLQAYVDSASASEQVATASADTAVEKATQASASATSAQSSAVTAEDWAKYAEGKGNPNWGYIGGDIENQADLMLKFDAIDDKIKEIELFKFPNADIIGEPTIQSGQVSGFSTVSYLQFPFIMDLRGNPFQIDFSFTTSTNVQAQQNILDSKFGLALAIKDGKGLMAVSSNGTSWNIGQSIGTMNIESNTTYYARVTWDGLQYKTFLSTNGTDYVQDMTLVGTQSPFPRTMFIGGCNQLETGHEPHPFLGSINLNKAYLSIRGSIVWQGMDDAGLATRADISLSNLDSEGQAKFDAKQDVSNLSQTLDNSTTKYPSNAAVKAAIDANGGGLEIGDIGFAPLGVDETQNKRRYLNGQVISQSQFVSFTDKIKAAIQLYPNLATTEVNWQAEVTNSPYGICGKFVIDDAAGTIRLPKYPDWSIREVGQAAVVGNGMAIGLTDGTTNASPIFNTNTRLSAFTGSYGSSVGTTYTGSSPLSEKTVGITTDPTKSGMIANLTNANAEDKLQGKWFIQVATGVETSIDVSREIELNNPFSLLDYKWSEYELSNASWLLSNGQYNSGATYPAVYNLLLQIYNGTVTKAGVSVKLSTEAYADTDFVINTADTTFRLPIKVRLASGNAVIYEANGNSWLARNTNGTLKTQATGIGQNTSGQLNFSNVGTSTNLANLDPNGTLVSNSNGLKLYFYVGETVQDANVIAASQVLTRVADSVRKSSSTDRETVVGWGMPDYSAEVDIKSSVISANGYTCVSSGQCFFRGNSNSNLTIIINGKTVMVNSTPTGYAAGFAFNVDKGDVIKGNNVYSAQFFPLKGVN